MLNPQQSHQLRRGVRWIEARDGVDQIGGSSATAREENLEEVVQVRRDSGRGHYKHLGGGRANARQNLRRVSGGADRIVGVLNGKQVEAISECAVAENPGRECARRNGVCARHNCEPDCQRAVTGGRVGEDAHLRPQIGAGCQINFDGVAKSAVIGESIGGESRERQNRQRAEFRGQNERSGGQAVSWKARNGVNR